MSLKWKEQMAELSRIFEELSQTIEPKKGFELTEKCQEHYGRTLVGGAVSYAISNSEEMGRDWMTDEIVDFALTCGEAFKEEYQKQIEERKHERSH